MFIGERFIFSTLEYKVQEVKIVNYKAVIKTDRRTFCFLESELDDFMGAIKFVDVESFPSKMQLDAPVLEVQKIWEENELVPQHEAVLLDEPSNAHKVSSKLMDVFNDLLDNPSEEVYKKASAMVNVGNSIVNAELAHWKLLTLKR
jgi:hypothetical protein